MRRRFAIPLVAALAALVAVVGAPRPAHAACTCSATTAEQGMRDATLVFLGSLTDISPPAADGLISLDFDVRLVYKGDVGATTGVQTFESAEQCGFGDTVRRGEWLVFAYRLGGAEDSPPLLSTCSPSGPLTSESELPVELGQGRAPPGAAEYVPVLAERRLDTFYGSVTDPRDTTRQIVVAVGLLAVIGLGARLLAGRRRFVVR